MLDHLDDIASDMSVFHRVDDVWSMPAHRFIPYAERLFAYDGVLTARARAEAAESQPALPAEQPARYVSDVVEVESTAAAIAASPLGQICSIAQV